jgi:hypothetical protein
MQTMAAGHFGPAQSSAVVTLCLLSRDSDHSFA